MTRNFNDLNLPRIAACALATVLVLGGSSCSAFDQDSYSGPKIGRCLDRPIPVDESAHVYPFYDPTLEYSFGPSVDSEYTSFLEEDPIFDQTVYDLGEGSIVRIETKDSKGTGVMISSGNEEYIATAAHVVYGEPIRGLEIVNDDGEEISVQSACFVLENNGRFVKEPDEGEGVADIDFAILKVSDKETSFNGLNPAKEEPQRGEWTHFVNYQGDNEPGYPAFYTGVVVADADNDPNKLEITTGLRKLKTPVTVGDFESNTIQAGASGGPVLNQKGEVVGVSVSGLMDGYYDTREELEILYNIKVKDIDYGPEEGLMPVTAGVMPIDIIMSTIDYSKKV